MGSTGIKRAKLNKNRLPVEERRSMVKFCMKVPKTSAGMNNVFSSFARIPAVLAGNIFHFAKANPKMINKNKYTVWFSVDVNTSIVQSPFSILIYNDYYFTPTD